MKKRFTHADIKQCGWYKVISKPEYWDDRHKYLFLGKIGQCQWVNITHGVNMIFDNSIERIIPPYCLEPAEDPNKEKVVANKILGEPNVKIGDTYLVFKTPSFYKETDFECPVVGKFGTLIAIRGTGCLLTFGEERKQHFIPFDCLQETGKIVNDLYKKPTDEELISKIIDNPFGVLKIIKGLAKMNKNSTLKNLLEKGSIV